MTIFISLFFLCSSAFAQSALDEYPVINKLLEREKEILNQTLEAQGHKYNRVEKEALKVQLADILSSPTFTGYVLKGSTLVNLLTDQEEYLPKNLYVKVHAKRDDSGYQYLQDKNGKTLYKTRSKNVANITEVTKLREPPLFYRPVEKIEGVKTKDRRLELSTEFNVHVGATRPYFTRDLVNDQSEHNGQAVRYELQAYGDFQSPFTMGASLMVENMTGTLNSQGETYAVTALSFGPIVKFSPFFIGKAPIVATLGARSSLFANIIESRVSQTVYYRLAQTSVFLGLQREFDLPYGDLVVGVNLQRQWTKATSSQFNTDLDFAAKYDDSAALSLGYKMDWL